MEDWKIVFQKTCQCGNVIILLGMIDIEARSTGVKVQHHEGRKYGEFDASLYGKASVKCKCGKVYRSFNRSTWHHSHIK